MFDYLGKSDMVQFYCLVTLDCNVPPGIEIGKMYTGELNCQVIVFAGMQCLEFLTL